MDYQKAIKQLREALLITQTELADILGVTYQTVNRWEKGYHQPTMKAKRRLMKLFQKYGIVGD